MRLDKVIVENFLTYEQEEYVIPNRPLQIQGKNLTEEDQESNGSGKSGIFTAIEFCITASNSRDVRDSELVMFGQSQARTQLFASCDIRKESLHIDWTIKVKGSNKLTLSKATYGGEWEEISFSNVNDGKKYIMSWFDISRDDLFNYYIINKTRFKSFFKASQKEKVDLINRFSDASIIDGLEKIDNSEFQIEYDEKKSAASRVEGKIELVQANIDKENSRDFSTELKEDADDLNEEIEDISSSIEEVKKSITLHKETIKKCGWDINNRITLREILTKSKKPKENQITEEDQFISEIKENLTDAQTLVNDFLSQDWTKKRKTLSDLLVIEDEALELVEKKDNKESIQETQILSFLQSIEVKLQGSITCPNCTHEFILEGDIDELKTKQTQGKALKEQLKTKQASTQGLFKAIKDKVADIDSKVSKINSEERIENDKKNLLKETTNSIQSKLITKTMHLSQLQEDLNAISLEIKGLDDEDKETLLEIKEYEGEIKGFNTEIKNYNNEINQYKTQLDNLKKGNNKKIIKEYKDELKKLKSELVTLEEEIVNKGDEIYLRNQWINNFKQFRMHLANQSLEAIEFHCNRYLVGMGSDLKVKFEGYRMLANGTIKDEITAKIVRNVERTFSSFSGGEQGRLLFAAILANRHMINQSHQFGGLDFLCVDEVFEGIDGLGLKSLIKSAKSLEIPVLIVTHIISEEISDDKLTIIKENGISRIDK